MAKRAYALQTVWEVFIVAVMAIALVAVVSATVLITTLQKRQYTALGMEQTAPVVWIFLLGSFLVLALFVVLLYTLYMRPGTAEQTALYVLTVARDGKILSINKQAPGFIKAKILGSKIYRYIPEENWPAAQHILQKAFATAKPVVVDMAGIGAYGRPSFYRTSVEPIVLGKKVIAALFMSHEIKQNTPKET